MTTPADPPLGDPPQAKDIFVAASALPPEQRESFVENACRDHPDVRARVQALLNAYEGAAGFLEAGSADGSVTPGLAESTHRAGDSMLETLPDPLLGTRIGRYKLLERIGEGGFGAVYMAEQREPVHRKVALKLIKPGMDSRMVSARFEAERQALALMEHAHIARVFDGGVTDAVMGARPYFVMEYVRGDPITAFADAHRLNIRDRLDLVTHVCQAVQHAHTKGIIHRDLKPRNVLVSMVDGRPFSKVIDFGIAKATGSPLTDKTLFTEHRQLIGTPEYMSPEQAEGSPDIDTRTDVYALGVLLYELLTGATPFDAKRLRSAAFAEMQRIIREEEPPLPSVRLSRSLATLVATAAARQCEPGQLSTLVRGELDWIAMKALDKDRARRYETASQLAADVQRHLSGEPVVAAPPSAAYRLRKFVRKHRGPVLASTIAMMILSFGIVGTSLGLWVARQQRDVAIGAQRAALAANAETDRQRAAAELSAYAANIASAAMALDRVDTNELIARLEACPERLRGFEWRLLKALSDQADVVLRGHTAVARIIRFHPSVDQVATGSRDKTVRLWNASSGTCMAVLKDLDSVVHALAYCDDGELIAAGAENGRVCIWNAASGQLVATLRGHTVGPVGWVAFAPGSRRLVTTAKDATTRLWDGDTGEQLWVLEHSTPAKRAIFSPDGKLLLTTCDDEARFWETASGEPRSKLEGVSWLVKTPAFRPDGAYVVGTLGSDVFAWETATGARFEEYDGRQNWFGTFLSDGRVLYARPGVVEIGTGQAWWRFGWEDTLHPIAVNSSPRLRIATGASDDAARLWDAEYDNGLLKTLLGHTARVVQIRFSADGKRVATAAWDNEPRIWSVSAGNGVQPNDDGDVLVYVPAQTHDGALLATLSPVGTVRIWNSRSGEVNAVLRGHTGHGRFAEFSHDDRHLLTVADDATVRVWSVADGREVHLLPGHVGVARARFSPDDSMIVSVSKNRTGRVWSHGDGRFVELLGHEEALKDGVFSPDGQHVATASNGQAARRSAWTSDGLRPPALQPRKPLSFDLIAGDNEPHRTKGAARIFHLVREHGGLGALVLNTVRDAQNAYDWLRGQELGPIPLHLFHARFTAQDRDAIENCVLQRFGKWGKRTPPAILIATQVVEQSLDLDFDHMVTALAPIDLLIQRAGRLHRHPRSADGTLRDDDRDARPNPVLHILAPPGGVDGVDDIRDPVYSHDVLMRTLRRLRTNARVERPSDVSDAIEAVYGEADRTAAVSAWERRLSELEEQSSQRARQQRIEADRSTIRSVDDADKLIVEDHLDLDDNDERQGSQLAARTRLEDRPSITVALLREEAGRLVTIHGGDPAAPKDAMLACIRLSPPYPLWEKLLALEPLLAWNRKGALARTRPLVLLQGREQVAPYEIWYATHRGLSWSKPDAHV